MPVDFIQTSGLNYKANVRAASTSNVNLAAPGPLMDTVALVVNDRVLLKDQDIAAQNAIYVWNGPSANLTRASDALSFVAITNAIVICVEGDVNGGRRFWQTAIGGTINVSGNYWVDDGDSAPLATPTVPGLAPLATQAEVNAGLVNNKIVTPATLKNISSNLDFANTRRIINLPPAVAAGQPVIFEQLGSGGGGAIESATLTLSSQAMSWEQSIARSGTLETQSVEVWLADHPDNELWQLDTATIMASCATDTVTFYFSSQYFEFGNINVKFKVS